MAAIEAALEHPPPERLREPINPDWEDDTGIDDDDYAEACHWVDEQRRDFITHRRVLYDIADDVPRQATPLGLLEHLVAQRTVLDTKVRTLTAYIKEFGEPISDEQLATSAGLSRSTIIRYRTDPDTIRRAQDVATFAVRWRMSQLSTSAAAAITALDALPIPDSDRLRMTLAIEAADRQGHHQPMPPPAQVTIASAPEDRAAAAGAATDFAGNSGEADEPG